jgi:hypothetical protein
MDLFFLFLVFSCLSSAYIPDRPARLGVAVPWRGPGRRRRSGGFEGPEVRAMAAG